MMRRTMLRSAVLLLGTLPLAACGGVETASVEEVQAAQAAGLQPVSFKSNPYCGGCAATIKAQLEEIGVQAVTANLDTKVFSGYYDPEQLTPERIQAAVEKVGYTVAELKTGDQAVGA